LDGRAAVEPYALTPFIDSASQASASKELMTPAMAATAEVAAKVIARVPPGLSQCGLWRGSYPRGA
jgi:hypothetical protein